MEPRFGELIKSKFGLAGNFFDARLRPPITQMADNTASEQVGHTLAAL